MRPRERGGGDGINLPDNVDFTITNSAVTANTNQGAAGGGISIGKLNAVGPVSTTNINITRSTIANNTLFGAFGGSLFIQTTNSIYGIDVDIRHSTITGNVSGAGFPGTSGLSEGAGIYIRGDGATFHLENSILAKNRDISGNPTPTQSDDIEVSQSGSPTVTTGGNNYIGTVTDLGINTPFTPAGLPNASNDFIGTAPAGLDPVLLALDYNGGVTRSRPPASKDKPGCRKGKLCRRAP